MNEPMMQHASNVEYNQSLYRTTSSRTTHVRPYTTIQWQLAKFADLFRGNNTTVFGLICHRPPLPEQTVCQACHCCESFATRQRSLSLIPLLTECLKIHPEGIVTSRTVCWTSPESRKLGLMQRRYIVALPEASPNHSKMFYNDATTAGCSSMNTRVAAFFLPSVCRSVS